MYEPSPFTATVISGTRVDLAWNNQYTPTGGDYESVEVWVQFAGVWSLYVTLAGSAESRSATSLTDGLAYGWQIAGVFGATKYWSVVRTVTTTLTPPDSLTANPAETTVDLAWHDHSTGNTAYKVYRGGTLIATLGANVTSYTATGLTKDTAYTFSVCAYNAAYGLSTAATVNTTTLDLPAAPGNPTATALGTTSIKLDWDDLSDNEASFRISRKAPGESSFTLLATLAAGTETYTDTGLDYGSLYYYRVYAYNLDGPSSSDIVSATTTEHTAWVKMPLDVARIINTLSILTPANNFKNFTVHGSNDDSAYTLIYSGLMDGTANLNTFTLGNTTAYLYYKVTSVDNYAKSAMKIFSMNGEETTPANEWLKFQAVSAIVPVRIIITPYNSGVQNWGLYGSNDGTAYTLITSGVCVAGSSENEFTFDNVDSYDYFKLLAIDSHGGVDIAVASFSLYAATPPVADTNYYIFTKVEHEIVRKVIFPDYASMLDFITTWKAAHVGWATTYWCQPLTFDIDDSADVAAKVTAETEFTLTEANLLSKINETLAVATVTGLATADTLFGVPSAYAISLASTGQTSFHELKRRAIKQELVGGVWTDMTSPEIYAQTKYVFVTAESNLLLCSIDDNDHITGYTIIGTGLKASSLGNTVEPCWANFQNRAFMVNGAESDCNAVWTDGSAMYLNGMVAPTMITDVAVHTVAAATEVSVVNDTITIAAHGYRTNQRVLYTAGTGSIAELTTATIYFVRDATATTFKLAATADGAAIDFVTANAGNFTITGSPITQAATGGFMSDGAYSLKLRYHRSTYGTNDSNPSSELSITLSGGGAAQKITLDVVFSSDPQVDEVHIYRTKLGDALFYKAIEHDNDYTPADPTKVHQIDITPNDNSLGTGALETDNDPAPKSKFIVTLGMINRMGYVNDDGAYFSKSGFPEQVPLANLIPIGEDDGEEVTGTIVCNGWWVVCKETRLFAIDLANITQLKAVCISGSVGLLDWKTLAMIGDGQAFMGLSQMGFFVSDGVNVTNISRGKPGSDNDGNASIGSRNMNDFVENFDYSLKGSASAVFYPKRQLYVCCAPYKGLDELGKGNYRLWIYDVVRGSFYKWKFPIQPLRLFLMTDHNDIGHIISSFTQSHDGEYYGYFMVHDDESDYLDTVSITFAGVETRENIVADLITSWFDLGIPERNKSFRMLYADVCASAAATITISVGINHRKTFTPDVSTLVHAGETGTAPTVGRDEIEGFDYGRSRIIPTPVDAVGEEFAIRFQCSSNAKVRLNGFTAMFRVRGARP
jgi:hypothetical protein